MIILPSICGSRIYETSGSYSDGENKDVFENLLELLYEKTEGATRGCEKPICGFDVPSKEDLLYIIENHMFEYEYNRYVKLCDSIDSIMFMVMLAYDKYVIGDVYNLVKGRPLIKKLLFDQYTDDKHPVEYMYVYGLNSVFELIISVYERDFNILYKTESYSEYRNLLEYIVDHQKEEFDQLLDKYSVTNAEFDRNVYDQYINNMQCD